ncbi:MAG: TonB-dependent receptor [Bacteroidota bacterium]
MSQSSLLDAEVSFSAQTAPIHFFLSGIESAAEITFSYGKEVPVSRTFSMIKGVKSIREHLDDMFRNDSLEYVVRGKKILIVPATSNAPKQMPKQTIRGQIIDLDSKIPLIGVNILLGSEGPTRGTITDEEGYFRFENIPVGRHALNCSYIGYEPESRNDLVLASGKESVVNIEMEESITALDEVRITALSNKSKPINGLTFISGRSFTAYEVENYPGSISDISRAAVSFPGVVSPNDGQNHIIIRGNSPKGLQWRLEGIEIPNLNHFSEIGASGGGVNVVSSHMLASSDFLTGAFPAEYGNALSGVFDLRLRTGNNEKHEQTFQLGLLGTEVMLEGPISKTSNTTYIAQYRYSTLKLVQKIGFDLQSVPDFQDISFKIYHPTKKMGVFSIFGIGGLSHEEGTSGYVWNSNTATLGLTNNYTFNEKTFLRSVIAFSGWNYTWDNESNIGSAETPINREWNTNVIDYTLKGSLVLNRKINARHKIKAGIIYEMAFNDSYMAWFSDTLYNWYNDPNHPDFQNLKYNHEYVNSKEHASTFQTFVNWKYRISDAFSLNTGTHFIQFYLNNNFSIEPRIGLQWKAHSRHVFSAGFGIHSRKESMTLYSGNFTTHDGAVIHPNKDLELAKAKHYVLGYSFLATDYLNLKTEIYYQDLYDIPAYPFPPYFSTLNFDYGFEGNILSNYGTGYNTGIEVSLEKYMSKGYHFMLNGSLYESKYFNKLGEKLDTKYNGTYVSNGLFGKEFKLGKGKHNTLIFNTRYILVGGVRTLPINEQASREYGYSVRYWEDGFSVKNSDYFRVDLLVKFRRNKPGYTSEWSIDVLNILNRQNVLTEYWDHSSNEMMEEYQNPTIAVISYRIQF